MKNLGKTIKSANLKGKTFAIALILVLAVSTAMAIMPVKAQVPGVGGVNTYSATPVRGNNGDWNIPTFAGLTCAPNPVGVGQPLQVILVIEQLPPAQGIEAVTGTTGGWKGLMLTVTDPNGTSTTMGPYETDVSGTYQVSFTPTQTGTYTFQFTWPGMTVDNTHNQGGSSFVQYWGNFLSSTSPKVAVTVQQTPAPGYTEAPVPLPNQYWTSPVNSQNRAWNVICGPWLQSNYNATGPFNPYSYAPMSAHILWTQQPYVISSGGIAGGDYGSLDWGGMNSSPTGFSLVCVMNGYAYYNGPTQNANVTTGGVVYNQAVSYFYCMNIQTGHIMWSAPGSITCGQMLCQRAQQTKSVTPYLWSIGGTYSMYSASTGALAAQWHSLSAGATIANSTAVLATFGGSTPVAGVTPTAVTVMSGSLVLEKPNPTIIGQNVGFGMGGGALLEYIYGRNSGQSTGYLMCWNSSQAIVSYCNNPTGLPALPSITQQLTTTPLDWNWGIMWNISVPLVSTDATYANGTVYNTFAGWSLIGCDGHYAILQTQKNTGTNSTGITYRTLAGIEVDNLPITTTYTQDIGGDYIHPTTGSFAWVENYSLPAYDQTYTGNGALLDQGNIIIPDNPLMTLWDFSESTGALLWSSTPFNDDFAMQSMTTGVVANGMLYNPGYDGWMHAINTTTGVQMWESPSAAGGLEMPQPHYPMSGCLIAGNTPSNTVVFTSTKKSYEAQPVYRGHELFAFNAQTGAQIWNISGEFNFFCVDDGVLLGSNNYDNQIYAFGVGPSATTVTAPMTSVAAGTSCIIQGTVTDQTPGILMGTPAVSDTWQTAWMEYIYMDQPMPTQATGVTVNLSAIDPNGNYITIGSATSDISGTYIYQWTPPNIPGKYTIIASFGADNSYSASSGETGMTVAPQAVATPAPTATPTAIADTYFIPAIAGLFVLIIVGLVVLALLMLRKRP